MSDLTSDDLERMEDEVWADFLKNASQEEIFQSVLDSNWDGNGFLLSQIKDNPTTDKATILLAYWMSNPGWFKQFADREEILTKARHSIEGFDFVAAIEKKYLEGFYTQSNIALDPANDPYRENWTEGQGEGVASIPSLMFEKLEGKKVGSPTDFEEGLPPEYAQRLQVIIAKYDE